MRGVLQWDLVRGRQSSGGVRGQRDDVPQLRLDRRLVLGWGVPLRWWSRVWDRSAMLEWRLHLRCVELPVGLLQRQHLRQSSEPGAVRNGRRRVCRMYLDRQRVYERRVSLRLRAGVRAWPALLGRNVRLRFDVVPVWVLQRRDVRDGHHLEPVRDQRQRVRRVWHQRRSVPQRQL